MILAKKKKKKRKNEKILPNWKNQVGWARKTGFSFFVA